MLTAYGQPWWPCTWLRGPAPGRKQPRRRRRRRSLWRAGSARRGSRSRRCVFAVRPSWLVSVTITVCCVVASGAASSGSFAKRRQPAHSAWPTPSCAVSWNGRVVVEGRVAVALDAQVEEAVGVARGRRHGLAPLPVLVETASSVWFWAAENASLNDVVGDVGRDVGAGRVDPRRVDPRRVDPGGVDPRRVDPRRIDPRRVDPRRELLADGGFCRGRDLVRSASGTRAPGTPPERRAAAEPAASWARSSPLTSWSKALLDVAVERQVVVGGQVLRVTALTSWPGSTSNLYQRASPASLIGPVLPPVGGSRTAMSSAPGQSRLSVADRRVEEGLGAERERARRKLLKSPLEP